MNLQTISRRYARALADITIKGGESREVFAELGRFSAVLYANPELVGFLVSPVIPLERKREIVRSLLSELALRPTSSNFLRLLLENYRLHRLDIILVGLERELDLRAGILSAHVTTARMISDSERSRLREQLHAAMGQAVRLKFEIDASVIGGVVTRIGSTVYDGSIRGQLEQLKQRLARAK